MYQKSKAEKFSLKKKRKYVHEQKETYEGSSATIIN